MTKWWKKNNEGEYELKTMEDLAKENLQQGAKSRKMCFELNSLDDIASEIPLGQLVFLTLSL